MTEDTRRTPADPTAGKRSDRGDREDEPPLRIGGKLEEFVPVRLVERGDGRLVVASVFDARHLNAAGIVHGGFIASLLDVALAGAGAAAINRGRGTFGITLSMTVNFVRPLGPGGVSCVAEVSGGGARTKFVDARLQESAAGPTASPAATATATVRIVDLD